MRRWLLALWISRASAASVVLGAALFIFNDGIHDILRGLAQDLGRWEFGNSTLLHRLIMFVVMAAIWAIAVHYTARVLLWIDFGMLPSAKAERKPFATAFRQMPRFLAVAAFGSIILGLAVTLSSTGAHGPEACGLLALIGIIGLEALLFVMVYANVIDRLRLSDNHTKQVRLAVTQTFSHLQTLFRAVYPRTPDPNTSQNEKDAAAKALGEGIGQAIVGAIKSVSKRGKQLGGIWRLLQWVVVTKDDIQQLYVASAVRNRSRTPNGASTIQAAFGSARDPSATVAAVLFLLLVVGFGMMIFAMVAPLAMARIATQSGVVFLILSTWLPLFSAIVFLDHWRQFPTIVVLILLAFLLQAMPTRDVHDLRLTAKSENTISAPVPPRLTLSKSLEAWRIANGAEEKPVPFIIVSTAGGGSRAAYWTATVLGALQDADPHFRCHLFAVSAVSGGALGTATFAALLHDREQGVDTAFCTGEQPTPAAAFKVPGQTFSAGDFLAPTLAALGYQDVLYWATAIPLASDRATAIEWSWEKTWR